MQDEGQRAFLHDQQMYENERRNLLKREPVPAAQEVGEEPVGADGGRERVAAEQFRPAEQVAAPVEHMQKR